MVGTAFRWGVVVTSVLVCLFLAAPAGAQSIVGGPKIGAIHTSGVRRITLPNSAGLGNVLAVHNGTVFLSYTLTNGTSVVDEYVIANRTLTQLQVLPGGSLEYVSGVVWTDRGFFISIQNLSDSLTSFETVTLSGQVAVASVPKASSGLWSVVGSSGDAVYISTEGALLALNDDTYAQLRSFDSVLPAGAGINAVAQLGGRLYIGGLIAPVSGGGYAFYGAIDLSNGTLTTLSPVENYPGSYSTTVLSVVVDGGSVFFGGQAISFGTNSAYLLQTDGPLLFAYQPSSSSLRNLSSALPGLNGVGQLVTVGPAIGVAAPFWGLTTSGNLTGEPGFYLVNPSTGGAHNETALLGPSLLVVAAETAVSQGELVTMGLNLPTGDTRMLIAPV